MTTVTDLDESRLSEECEALEAVSAALAGPEPVAQRLERALQLLAGRLQVVRKRLAGMEPEGEGARHRSAAGRPLGLQTSLVGQSEALREVYEAIRRVSGSQATVLLRGESGTGKELVARAIHQHSPRISGPFVVINCGAIPEHLLESELFGHRKGSFTGAIADRKGLFEEAHMGTIFLDEIGELPLPLQVKLLRVLQEGEIRAVGDSVTKKIDVRLLAATNRDLQQLVKEGKFREDLYYRLNVINIMLPSLRDRLDDVPLLAYHFLKKYVAKVGKSIEQIAVDAMQALQNYSWPGNIRELENVIERAVVLATSDVLTAHDLPPRVLCESF